MYLPLLIALRFLKSSTTERSISAMVSICFISIVIGTGSLTLIASIMNGFEHATHKKLQGIHSDLMIFSDESIDYPKLENVLINEFSHEIVASAPSALHHVMLQNVKDQTTGTLESSFCLLRAIDPQAELRVSTLEHMILSGFHTPITALTTSQIIIGYALAEKLKLEPGSRATLIYQQEQIDSTQQLRFGQKKVIVASLFKTGMYEFDEQLIMAPFSLVDTLFDHRVTQVSLALRNRRHETNLKTELSKRFSLEVTSWKDLYPQLVSALTLEKYAMWFILLLVTCVASLTVVALLFMFTRHKQADIALLKAMGMTDSALQKVFLFIAYLITLSATLCGIVVAASITWLLNTYPFIKLPDVYYTAYLPASLDFAIIGAMLAFAALVSFCAGLFPYNSVKSMRIAQILKGSEA